MIWSCCFFHYEGKLSDHLVWLRVCIIIICNTIFVTSASRLDHIYFISIFSVAFIIIIIIIIIIIFCTFSPLECYVLVANFIHCRKNKLMGIWIMLFKCI